MTFQTLRTSKLAVSLLDHIVLRYLILLLLLADVEVSTSKDSNTSIRKKSFALRNLFAVVVIVIFNM